MYKENFEKNSVEKTKCLNFYNIFCIQVCDLFFSVNFYNIILYSGVWPIFFQ